MPHDTVIPCKLCKKGNYINANNECINCPIGYYSNTEDARECKKCEAGKYTTTVELYQNIADIPEEFENECIALKWEMSSGCGFTNGWIAVNGSFTTHPLVPASAKLTLRRKFAIIQQAGSIEFGFIAKWYKLNEQNKEKFKIRVDRHIIGIFHK